VIVVCNCVVDQSDQAGLKRSFDAGFGLIVMTENIFQYRIGECLQSGLNLRPLLGYVWCIHFFK